MCVCFLVACSKSGYRCVSDFRVSLPTLALPTSSSPTTVSSYGLCSRRQTLRRSFTYPLGRYVTPLFLSIFHVVVSLFEVGFLPNVKWVYLINRKNPPLEWLRPILVPRDNRTVSSIFYTIAPPFSGICRLHFFNILTLLTPTQPADNLFHSFTVLCENENFLISSLHCFFANVMSCPLVLLSSLVHRGLLRCELLLFRPEGKFAPCHSNV